MNPQEIQNLIDDLKKRVDSLEKKSIEDENKIRSLETIMGTHQHSGNDGSDYIWGDGIVLKPGAGLASGKFGFVDLRDNKLNLEYGFLTLGESTSGSGLLDKLGNSTQISVQHQSGTNTSTNQTFYYGFRYPVFSGNLTNPINITSGDSTLTQSQFQFVVNELAGAHINIYNSAGTFQYVRQIASNTATVITIDGTFPSSVAGGYFLVLMPIYFGASDFPWRQGYFGGEDVSSGGTGAQNKVLRFGYGTSSGADVIAIYFGTGSPESVVTANIGSLYLRTEGSTSTTLYVKTASNGANTGWTAK